MCTVSIHIYLVVMSIFSIFIEDDAHSYQGLNAQKVNTHCLSLRGGVGAPLDFGAPDYNNEMDPWTIMYPQLSKTLKAPDNSRIDIPGTHVDVKSAIESVEAEHDIFISGGDYRWDDHLTLPFHSDMDIEIRVHGIKGVRLLGRWILPASEIASYSSSGTFHDLVCAYATSEYHTEDYKPNAVFSILGGPWVFDLCEVRAASADALVTLDQAEVSMSHCQVGGMGLPWTLNGTMGAVNGLSADGNSCIRVDCCTFEFCGCWGGCALRFVGESTSTLLNSTIKSSMLGLGMNGGCKVKVSLCLFRDNHFAHLMALENASHSHLELLNCKLHEGREYKQGCMWAGELRPGNLDERDNKFIEGWSARQGEDDWFTEHEDIPEDQWETHPELIRLDHIEDYVRYIKQQKRRRDKAD